MKEVGCGGQYLEGRLKLSVNREKSRTVSVFAIQNFKFLCFGLGRNGIYVLVHPKSWKKFKSKLKDLSSRRSVQNIKTSFGKIKVYAYRFTANTVAINMELQKKD